MLSDPAAVKEAEAMMQDPEFKSEISSYMETLKNNDAFRQAMAEAQRKYAVCFFSHRSVGVWDPDVRVSQAVRCVLCLHALRFLGEDGMFSSGCLVSVLGALRLSSDPE